MIVTREWIIACKCPDCDVLMSPLSFVREDHFPKEDKMGEAWFMTPGFMQGIGPFTCPQCGVKHESYKLTPEMIAVEPGTTTPLAKRGHQPLKFHASVGEWRQIMDKLPMNTQSPLIDKISAAIMPFENEETVVKIRLTLDEQITIEKELEVYPAATG